LFVSYVLSFLAFLVSCLPTFLPLLTSLSTPALVRLLILLRLSVQCNHLHPGDALSRVGSFARHDKYEEKAASSMALEWCSRMQHYYDIYAAQDDPDFLYTQEQLDSYEESLEFIDFMLAIPDEYVVTLDRCRKLRAMKPINPE
jgi:hypothetical protein